LSKSEFKLIDNFYRNTRLLQKEIDRFTSSLNYPIDTKGGTLVEKVAEFYFDKNNLELDEETKVIE
jgi:hypothetical protein